MDVLVRDGFVESDSLVFTLLRSASGYVEQVRLDGIIHCADGVALDVTKFMDVRYESGRMEVISTYYRYHAWRPGASGESVVRYDQAHGQPHCHRFERDGRMSLQTQLTLDEMPRLDEVVREAVAIARGWDADRPGEPG